MKTIIIIIWLLLGCIAAWRSYWGTVKDWYETFNKDIHDYDNIMERVFISFVVFIICGGLISLILLELTFNNVWYYKRPKK